jgi:magnesium-transporting ATPase (P-type)
MVTTERLAGLTSAQARERLVRFGANEVPEKKSHPIAALARRFWGLSAWMIELIAILSLLLHKRADFWIAVALLLINALLGFVQEQRASAAVTALRHQLEVTARVLGLGDIARAPELRGRADAASAVDAHDGFAEVFPEDKFNVVKTLQEAGHVVGMTGDGVNDAPALRQAEVGVAVVGAADVAKSAASVVLTTEGLGGIVDLVVNGRAIYQRVLTRIRNKISRTILKAGFVVLAFIVTGRFVISALAMVLLVFMTDFVKIALATDRARGSLKPESWNIGPLVRVGVALGCLMLAESLGLLAIGWRRFGLGQGTGLETFTFQVLLFFALFSIVSIRERRWFWASWPSAVLALALVGDALAGLAIGRFGMAELRPIPLTQTAFVIGYAALASLTINDLVKTLLIRRITRTASHDVSRGAKAAAFVPVVARGA